MEVAEAVGMGAWETNPHTSPGPLPPRLLYLPSPGVAPGSGHYSECRLYMELGLEVMGQAWGQAAANASAGAVDGTRHSARHEGADCQPNRPVLNRATRSWLTLQSEVRSPQDAERRAWQEPNPTQTW